ncbi:hypothetical protein LP416_27670 [Polaromonas sp. P2-4]|nr:hypothetical protein LP416_27670 [Polaromonas sp. P2-4]
MKQLTKEEAIAMCENGVWKSWTPKQRAIFQCVQGRLCMPFAEFHKAVQETLGRPVFTHEFGSLGQAGILRELAGTAAAPSMAEIIALLPADKTIVMVKP